MEHCQSAPSPRVMPGISGPSKNTVGENPEADKNLSYPWFDWLRFVLASVVVLEHAGFRFAPFLTGGLAVSVFFALSGWLIGSILLRTEIADLPRFFFNRSTRIWIPYWVAVILLYGIAALREGIGFFWLKYLVLDVTFTHQLFTFFPVAKFEMPLGGSGNQFWSIAVEEQFYLLSPLVMLFVGKGKTLTIWLPISALALLFGTHAGPIALGVVAAILQRDYALIERPWIRPLALIAIVGGSLVLAVSAPSGNWLLLTQSIFSIAVVIFLAVPGKRSTLALFLGGLSYPLYLNHWLGLVLVNGSAKHLGLLALPGLPFIAFLTALALTLPLYWWVDRQVMNVRNEWFSHSLGLRLGLLAYALLIGGVIAGILMHQFGPHGVVPPDFIERNGQT